MDAVIAQLVEQPPCKRQVVGSSPTCGSMNKKQAKMLAFLIAFFEWSKSATVLAAPFFRIFYL